MSERFQMKDNKKIDRKMPNITEEKARSILERQNKMAKKLRENLKRRRSQSKMIERRSLK